MIKKQYSYIQRCLLGVIAVLFFGACSESQKEKQYFEVTGLAQGTYYRVVYEDTTFRKAEFDSLLKNFDTTFSAYIQESMLSRINNNDSTVILSDQFNYFITKSQYIASITDSVFDITVAPLVNAWKFGPDSSQHPVPTQAQIDSIRTFVGMDKFSVENNKFKKQDPRVQIIGNAIAQGYSTDLIAEYLDKRGVSNYLVDVGCEMRSKGVNSKGKIWNIGITRPEEGIDNKPVEETYDVVLQLNNKSLATSGNYRKFYYEDGTKYSHTINPKTGQTVPSDLLSATVIADECIEADAIATACMAMGVEKSKAFFQKHPEYEALLIFAQGDSLTTYKTKGIVTK
ncbi:MAG: FAD:protein FMN transferase [Bacteroidales bacterium]|nr:FAD:protein FMN transferase [Bacteroidales bacterium]